MQGAGVALTVSALAVGLGVPPIGAAAQQATGAEARQANGLPTEAQLLRRIDELLPLLEEAKVRASAAQSAREGRLAAARALRETSTLQVGPFRVVTLPQQVDLARELFEQVWREDFASLSGSPALERAVFAFQWTWSAPDAIHQDASTLTTTRFRRVELPRYWARTRAVVRARIRDAVWATLMDDLRAGSPIEAWLRGNRFPLASRAVRDLAITPMSAYPPCVAGRTQECLTALDLRRGRGNEPLEIRALLFLEAVRLGGVGAWGRVLQRPDVAPLDVLTHAAGVDEGTLMAAFGASFDRYRPRAHAGLGGTAATAVLWALALGALALRSTRWRLA